MKENEPKRYWRKISMSDAFQIAAERGFNEQIKEDETLREDETLTLPDNLFSRRCISYHDTNKIFLKDTSIIVVASDYDTDYYGRVDISPPEFAIGDIRISKG